MDLHGGQGKGGSMMQKSSRKAMLISRGRNSSSVWALKAESHHVTISAVHQGAGTASSEKRRQ